MDAPPIEAINGPVAGVEIRKSVESGGTGASAMTPVPQHFLASMRTLILSPYVKNTSRSEKNV